MFHPKIQLLDATYHVLARNLYVKQFLPTCVWQWETVLEIKSLKVKKNSAKEWTSNYSFNWKKLMVIMFSERLRHCQAATRIYVADAFCLSTWLLTSPGGIFFEVSNFQVGSVHCHFKTSRSRARCSISWGFKGFSKQVNVQTSRSRA